MCRSTPSTLLPEPFPVPSPSFAIRKTGLPYISHIRDATIPITPWCQLADPRTIALIFLYSEELSTMAIASLRISFSIFCLFIFSLLRSSAISFAFCISSVIRSRTATPGSSSRPAALILGPSLNPISNELNGLCIPLTSFNALIPGRFGFCILLIPSLIKILLVFVTAAQSATVPNATRSRKSPRFGSLSLKWPLSLRWRLNAIAKLNMTPTPAISLSG